MRQNQGRNSDVLVLLRQEGVNGRSALVVAIIDVLVVERCLARHDWGTQTRFMDHQVKYFQQD